MLYKNTKVKVCPQYVDSDYFNIVAGVLQGDTLAPYLFIMCPDYVLRMLIDLMKENSLGLKYNHRKITMSLTQTTRPSLIDLRGSKKGAHSAEVGVLAAMFEKSAAELKQKENVKSQYKCQHLTLEL